MTGYSIGAATNFGNGNDEIWDGGVLDSTRIIVNHLDATNFYPLVTVLEASGATINAGTTVNPDGTNTGIKLTQGIAALTSSLAHICWTKDAAPDVSYVRRITVSGTTPTLANTLTLSSVTHYPITICRLTDTKSLLLYMKTDAKMYARVLTDDGTDISEGAEQGWFDQALTTTQRINVERISDTLVCVAYAKSGALWNITLTVSGDTVALGKFVSPDSSSFYPSQVRARQIVILSSTKWVISYNRSSTDNRLVVVEDTGSLVAGTPIQISGSNDYISAIGAVDSTHVVALVRDSLRMITFTESSRSLSNDADDSTVPDSTSPSAGTPVAGYVGKVTTDEWILATWDSNTEAQGYRATIDPSVTVLTSSLTLDSSTPAFTIFNRASLNTLVLSGNAETITLQPVSLNPVTLSGSAEFITLMPRYMQSLTLVSNAETLFVPHTVSLNTLTLASSAETLAIGTGGVSIAVNALTLVSNAETVGSIGVTVAIVMNTLTLASSAEDLGRVQVFSFSPTEVNFLRLTAHTVTARLTIFSPPILWSGIVSGVHDRGATIITYTGGSGALTFVRDFLQVIIGSTPGSDDIGRLRVDNVGSMSLVTGSFVVDENAIPWLPGMYVSIEHLFPIERINPRLAGGILYKFFDVPYTDQNGQDNTAPVCLAGCDQVAEKGAGNYTFDIDLSESYPTTAGVITSYGLSVAPTLGTTVVFDTGTGIGTVEVDRAGYWWAICSCTDSFGNTMERFVLLRCHDSIDTEFIEVKITGYREQWGEGIRLSVEARENITLSDVPDNAIAYLWHENKFDGAEGYVNILAEYNTILFNGYIRSDRDRSDFQTGDKSVTFELTTVDGLMENLPLRSITVRLKSQPTEWWQYQLLTTGEAIWFLFRWHSTIPWRHDMIGLRSFDKFQRRLAADFEEGTLFAMANRVAFERGVIAKLTCDRLGRLHFVQDSQLLNQGDRDAIVSAFDIQEEDVSGTIEIVRNPEPRVHTMQISGFDYDTQGVGTPYIAIIPGYQTNDISYSMPERRGANFRNIPHQLLQSQVEANERVGRYFAQANMPIKELRISFRGNYLTALTCIPTYGWYELNIQGTNLARELDIDNLRMLCRSITATIGSDGFIKTTAVFEPEASGPDGIVGNYPFDQPDLVATAELPTEVPPEQEQLLATSSASVRFTNPPAVEEADWTVLDATDYNHTVFDPWWRIINETVDAAEIIWWGAGEGQIVVADEKTGDFTDVTPATDPPNTWSDATPPTVATLSFIEILPDWSIQDRIYVVAEWQEEDTGNGLWRTWLIYTSDRGQSWTWYDYFQYYSLVPEARVRNVAVNGTYLLTSLYEGSAVPAEMGDYLRVIDKATFIGTIRLLLNAGDHAEPTFTWPVTWVTTVVDDDDLWYFFGWTNSFVPFASTMVQVWYTDNAGVTFQVFQSNWQFGRCLALRVGILTLEGKRKYWALKH